MKPITIDGKLDHLFDDDRDIVVEAMSVAERVPPYGSNNLYPPSRELTAPEAESINRIGMSNSPKV